jgi:hypothetical protein
MWGSQSRRPRGHPDETDRGCRGKDRVDPIAGKGSSSSRRKAVAGENAGKGDGRPDNISSRRRHHY